MEKLRPVSTFFARFGWVIIGALSAFAVGISIYALIHGITTVFPHVYYIPILAASYYYKRKGFYFSVLLSAIYVLLVVLLYPATDAIFAAALRAVIFIVIAGIIAYLAETLRHEEQIYRTIFHSNRTGMVVADDAGAIIQINPELENISGYTTEEAETSLNLSDLLGEQTFEWIATSCPEYAADVRTEDFCVFNASLTSKSDEQVPVIFSCSRIPDTNNLVLSITDISELMEVYEKISLSETRMKTLWEHVPAGIVVIDPENHHIVAANPEALHMIGVDKDEIVGQVCHKHICPAEQGSCPITDLHQTVDNSEQVLLTGTGEQMPVIKNVSCMTIQNKNYLVETFIDITQQKEAEKALLTFIRKTALWLRSPIEEVRENLTGTRAGLDDESSQKETVSSELQVQIESLSDIITRLSELEKATPEDRTEKPDHLQDVLNR